MDEKMIDLISITISIGKTANPFRLSKQGNEIVLANRDFTLSKDWEGDVDGNVYPPVLYLYRLNGQQLDPLTRIKIPSTNETISVKTSISEMTIQFKF